MSNEYYEHLSAPAPDSAGSSQIIRDEFATIQNGFAKLPTLTGNTLKLVRVNAAGTALEAGVTMTLANQDDVTLTSPAANHTLFYDSGGSQWVNKAPTDARTSLGLAIGTDVQAFSNSLTALAALSGTSGIARKTGASTWTLDTTAYVAVGDIGTTVQAQDAELSALAGLTSAANKLPYFTGSGTATLTDLSAFGRTLIDDANAATARATLGLVIGTNVQAYDADLAAIAALGDGPGYPFKQANNTWVLSGSTLTETDPVFTASPAGGISAGDITNWDTAYGWGDHAGLYSLTGHNHSGVYQPVDAELSALAGLTSAANKLPYFTGSGTATLTDLSAFGRTLIDDANAATARATLGLVIGTNVQAYNSQLVTFASLTPSLANFIVGDGASWESVSPTSARGSLGLGELATLDKATVSELYSLSGSGGITLDNLVTSAAPVVFSGDANLTLDWTAFNAGRWVVSSNRTLNNPINVIPGTMRLLTIYGTTTADRLITFGSYYRGVGSFYVDNTSKYTLSLYAESATEIVVGSAFWS